MRKEIKKEKIRKVFLDDLPKKEGIGYNKNKLIIDWALSIGYKVKFIYGDIESEVEIIDYKDTYLYIKYLDKPIFKIFIGNFIKSKLGNLLNKKTKDFIYKNGTVFKDSKRDITILDQKYKKDVNGMDRKHYKYHCNICNYEGWIVEGNLLIQGCACCSGKRVVENINSIWHTDKWMIPIINDDEFCKTHTHSCSDKIYPTCTDCGRIKDKRVTINSIYRKHGISCLCSDKISYGEKILFNVLEQLDIDFITQLSKTNFNWIGGYYYDFYFNNNLIEVNGEQHYIQTTRKGKRVRTLEEEQVNDRLKKELALSNGVKEESYIVIDCRYSNLEFIKNNILNSNLSNMFDLSKIDWLKCEEFALSNRVKECCKYWNSGIESVVKISAIMRLSPSTIVHYLNRGNKIWCNYDGKEEKLKGNRKLGKNGKQVICLETGKSFSSVSELERQSEKEFGFKLVGSGVSSTCTGRFKKYKGFHFKYVQDLTSEERILYKLDIQEFQST